MTPSRRAFLPHRFATLTRVVLASAALAGMAGSSAASVTLDQDAMVTGGGTASQPVVVVSGLIGEWVGGTSASASITLQSGYTFEEPAWPPGSRTITVTGTVNEPVASLTVNGNPVGVDPNGNFSAPVVLTEGANTITVTAVDLAGNSGSASVTVTLDTQPPAMPTVSNPTPVMTASSTLLSGTKQAGTSIWINGVQAVALDQATTWQFTVNLVEGNNTFLVVAKDAAGNVSATYTTTIILDNLPPVISDLGYVDSQGAPLVSDPASALPKTNFSPVTVTGQVDDNLTTVSINGVAASRTGTQFQAAVPIVLGLNVLTIHAVSPNNHVTDQTVQVVMGTIPTITAIQPANGTKIYLSDSVTIHATAVDAENDPLQCEILVDGVVLVEWMSNASYTWTPAASDLGIHMLEVRVKDAFGGSATQQTKAAVIHRPVSPP